jgi:hypothetical protein
MILVNDPIRFFFFLTDTEKLHIFSILSMLLHDIFSQQTPDDGDRWLFSKIDQNNEKDKLHIPRKKNREKYQLKIFNKKQYKIAHVILDKIHGWIKLFSAFEKEKKKFKPLRMSVLGCGGTGKSVLINTVVACIRKIFSNNNSVIVAALTGAAAYNAGGQTIHQEFKLD